VENYYKNELNKIDIKKGHVTVKFYGIVDKHEARELNVNLESIKEIKIFLNKIKKELENEKNK
jgi:2'-5' RNA ligase